METTLNTDSGWNDLKKGHRYTYNFLRYRKDNDSRRILASGALLKDLNYLDPNASGYVEIELKAIGLAKELVNYCHSLKLRFEQNVNSVTALAAFSSILKNGDNKVVELANCVEQHYNFTTKSMD